MKQRNFGHFFDHSLLVQLETMVVRDHSNAYHDSYTIHNWRATNKYCESKQIGRLH